MLSGFDNLLNPRLSLTKREFAPDVCRLRVRVYGFRGLTLFPLTMPNQGIHDAGSTPGAEALREGARNLLLDCVGVKAREQVLFARTAATATTMTTHWRVSRMRPTRDLEREFRRIDHELSRSISCSLTSQRGRGMAKTSLTAAPLKQSHSSDVGAGLELGAEPGDSGQVLHCH